MKSRAQTWTVYAYLGSGLAIAAAAIALIAFLAADSQNRDALETQTKIAQAFTRTALDPNTDGGSLVEIFGFANLEIAPEGAAVKGKVSIALPARPDMPAMRLWWTPDRPGDDLLFSTFPFAMLVFGGLAIVGWLFLRHWNAMLRDLYVAEGRAVNAEQESRAKMTFLGTMSHELRTPLNAIIGFSEVIEKEVFGPVGCKQYADYIKDIRASGHHLLSTLGDILDMAKIEAGEVTLALKPTNAAKELTETLIGLRDQASAKNLALKVMLDDEVPCIADTPSLRRVIRAVVSNAIKFTEPGGRIDIRVWNDDEHVRIVVKDTGVGIPLDVLPTLGKPFVQGEGHLARKKGGTGLGLSLSDALMKLMNGSLIICSRPGRGTTVFITLPAFATERLALAAE